MGYLQHAKQICSDLDELSLPRAFVDFSRNKFIAWNSGFLQRTGTSDRELRSLKVTDILNFGELVTLLNDRVELRTCWLSVLGQPGIIGGHAAVTSNGIGYVMIDVTEPKTQEFQQGRKVGQQEERKRLRQIFHDELSAKLLMITFLADELHGELKATKHELSEKSAEILQLTENVVATMRAALIETAPEPTVDGSDKQVTE